MRKKRKNGYALPKERILMPNPADGSDAYGLEPAAHLVPVKRTRKGAAAAPITSVEGVGRFMRGLGKSPVERFVTIPLDAQGRPLGAVLASSGTVNETFLHPREVFAPAIEARAVAVIVAHNHPSGRREPSAQDIDTTVRLLKVSKVVGIPLLDHVIIPGDGSTTSIKAISPNLWSHPDVVHDNPPRRNRAKRRPRLTTCAAAQISRWAATNPAPVRLSKRASHELFEDDHGVSRLRGRGRRRAAGDKRGPYFRRGMAGMLFGADLYGRSFAKNPKRRLSRKWRQKQAHLKKERHRQTVLALRILRGAAPGKTVTPWVSFTAATAQRIARAPGNKYRHFVDALRGHLAPAKKNPGRRTVARALRKARSYAAGGPHGGDSAAYQEKVARVLMALHSRGLTKQQLEVWGGRLRPWGWWNQGWKNPVRRKNPWGTFFGGMAAGAGMHVATRALNAVSQNGKRRARRRRA